MRVGKTLIHTLACQLSCNSCSRLTRTWEPRKISYKHSLFNSRATLVLVWPGHESCENSHTNAHQILYFRFYQKVKLKSVPLWKMTMPKVVFPLPCCTAAYVSVFMASYWTRNCTILPGLSCHALHHPPSENGAFTAGKNWKNRIWLNRLVSNGMCPDANSYGLALSKAITPTDWRHFCLVCSAIHPVWRRRQWCHNDVLFFVAFCGMLCYSWYIQYK